MQAYDYSQRDAMATAIRSRLSAVDARITALAGQADDKDKVQDLRQRSEQLMKQVENIDQQSERNWSAFRTRIQRDVAQLERDTQKVMPSSQQGG